MDKFRAKIGHEIGNLEGAFKGMYMYQQYSVLLGDGR